MPGGGCNSVVMTSDFDKVVLKKSGGSHCQENTKFDDSDKSSTSKSHIQLRLPEKSNIP